VDSPFGNTKVCILSPGLSFEAYDLDGMLLLWLAAWILAVWPASIDWLLGEKFVGVKPVLYDLLETVPDNVDVALLLTFPVDVIFVGPVDDVAIIMVHNCFCLNTFLKNLKTASKLLAKINKYWIC
jgi:hypothetical protein